MSERKFEKVGIVSTESVYKHTKKHWDDWVELLDKAGARNWTHKEIVAFVVKKYKLTPWWRQVVATGYEQAIGKKVPGKTAGGYTTVSTKTIPLSPAKLWSYLQSPKGLEVWLNPISEFKFKPKVAYETRDGFFGEVRTMKVKSRVRMSWTEAEWEKPSVLNIFVVPRKGEKSVLVFQHENIPDFRTRSELRVHWKEVLAALAESLKKE